MFEVHDLQSTNEIKSVNAFINFEEGLSKEKLKRIEMRKDAVILLNLKQKFDILYEQNYREKNKLKKEKELISKNPYFRLSNGRNLFTLSPIKLTKLYEVYEMSFKDLDQFDLDYVANLPSLADLSVRFSSISFNQILNKHFFPSLLYLSLPCNNLENNIFNYIGNLKTLKTLNLTGNKITGDIPDISGLKFLEELDLSYNQIKSQFLLNFEQLHNMVFTGAADNSENAFNTENTPNNKSIEKRDNHNISPNDLNKDFIEQLNNIEKKLSLNGDNTLSKTKESFEEWQKYLKTNLRNFFHNLAELNNLNYLNLSNNQIHFFDIDPFYIQKFDGFSNLKRLDFTNNLIEEEIAILLVMNIPKLEWLDISNNPIINKPAYTNLEYEVFKNKNIMLAHLNQDYINNNINKTYKVEKTKINSFSKFNKNVKIKINELTERRKQVEEEIENNNNSYVDILDYNNKNNFNYQNGEKIDVEVEYKIKQILNKNKNDNLFITNKNDVYENEDTQPRHKININKINTYDNFLELANKCFAKEIHYKKTEPKISIPLAYQRLRYALNNLQTEANDKIEQSNYMKNTISRTLHLDKNISN